MSDTQRAIFIHSHKIKTLEQASQLAQDIETSLRFSSQRRVIPKVRKQSSPNTHATRDPKSKSVIGESSKNVKCSQCFKCQGYDHVVAQCPSKNLLVRGSWWWWVEIVVYGSNGTATDSDDDVRVSSIQLGVIRCSHIDVRDEDWCRSSVFHTYFTHEGKNYTLMIDGGSCANIIAKITLEKMGLKAEPHPHPYNVIRFDKTAQSITQCCRSLSICLTIRIVFGVMS